MRVGLDLPPEPLHVDVERPRVAEVVGPPDLLDQQVAGEQAPGRRTKASRSSNSFGGKDTDLAADRDLVAAEVHPDRPGLDDVLGAGGCGGRRRATPQVGAHARHRARGPRTAS